MENTQMQIKFATEEEIKAEKVVEYEEDACSSVLPKVLDVKYFSPSNDLLLSLEEFNSRYNCSLSVQNSGKWAVGTYNVIKDMLTTQMFPHWFTKNGANSIHKFHKYNTWSYDRCMKDLKRLNDRLYGIRQANIKLFSEATKKEGAAWINKFNKKLQKSLKQIEAHACFSNTPYFSRNNAEEYKYMPVIYDADCVEEDYIGNLYSQDPNNMEECEGKDLLYQPHDDMGKPKSWFLNILIPLRDVNIDISVRKKNDEGYDVVDSLPWGDLVVGFTFNLLDLFKLNLVAHDIRKLSMAVHTANIGQFTYTFPKWFSWQHPFVSYRKANIPLHRNNFYSYDMGNTCFGDFKYEVIQQIVLGNINFAKTILEKWSSTFILHGTSPLNHISLFNFGLNEHQKDVGMVAETNLCEDTVRSFKQEARLEFQKEMCEDNKCVLKTKCAVYKRFTLLDHDFKYTEDDVKMLGPWKSVYEEIALICTTVASVYDYFKISTDETGDLHSSDNFRQVMRENFNPNYWKDDNKILGVPYFINYVLPEMERIYVLSNIKRESQFAYEVQLDNASKGDSKSNKALWKLYNNLIIQNGMTYQVDPDIAFINYCKDNNIIKEGEA